MVLWTASFFSAGIIYIMTYKGLSKENPDYGPYRTVLIMNDISLQAKFLNFLNVAYILYKSYKSNVKKHETES